MKHGQAHHNSSLKRLLAKNFQDENSEDNMKLVEIRQVSMPSIVNLNEQKHVMRFTVIRNSSFIKKRSK